MLNKSVVSFLFFFFLGAAFFVFPGCEVSDINKQESVTSGTSTGSGGSGSGGSPASVTVIAGSSVIDVSATTTITVFITDASGKRTDATITLTSSTGGTFNGTDSVLTGNTLGGVLITQFKASAVGENEVTATVTGTGLKGSTIISITGVVPTTP
jgi:hypothetical protein